MQQNVSKVTALKTGMLKGRGRNATASLTFFKGCDFGNV